MLIRELLLEDEFTSGMVDEMMNLITTYRFRDETTIKVPTAIAYLRKLGYAIDKTGLMDLLSSPPFKQDDGSGVVEQTTPDEIKLKGNMGDAETGDAEDSQEKVSKIAGKAAVKAVKSGEL